MSYNESPSLDEYKDGNFPRQDTHQRRKKIWRVLIGSLVLVGFGLWFWILSESGSVDLVLSRGTVYGRLVNAEGKPLSGEIFIQGQDDEVKTDVDGSFRLENAPAGSWDLVAGYNGTAEKYPVTIPAGGELDLGDLVFKVVTQVPEE